MMLRRLADYRDFAGEAKISELYRKGSRLSKFHILHVNSTYYGGGVAEILRNLLPLMNEIGIDIGWRAMIGSPDFFRVTKKFHNALQGDELNLTKMKKKVFEETNEMFASLTHVDHDLVVVHDLQPLPLVTHYKKRQPWVWRCHVDLSNSNKELWNYLKSFALAYDEFVFQMDEFAARGFSADYKVIRPSIDPLVTKNEKIEERVINKYLDKVGIDPTRPFISQVSRFDKWKDPEGVLEVYNRVKKEMDCQLVLVGSMATDDPEGQQVYDRVRKKASELGDVKLIVDAHDILVNSIQRASNVVLQKSVREGFGLSVAEALWKRTPVVASDVGGIPSQVIDGETGYLVDSHDYDDAAKKVIKLLSDDDLREEMGEKARQHVKDNFLVTCQIEDWLDFWTRIFE